MLPQFHGVTGFAGGVDGRSPPLHLRGDRAGASHAASLLVYDILYCWMGKYLLTTGRGLSSPFLKVMFLTDFISVSIVLGIWIDEIVGLVLSLIRQCRYVV